MQQNTYHYTQDEQTKGPYLEYQIVKLAEMGAIRADARITCVETNANGGLGGFLASISCDPSKSKGVRVADINMPFGSMIIFMIKWALASIPAALILAALFFFITNVLIG